jgi:geranylgeranyl pyrophosphate synthase
MGALISRLDIKDQLRYSKFGKELGMTFQIYDDWLGVWGDPLITGKSASSDLMEGKKSLPVLLGLKKSKRFLARWNGGPINPVDSAILSGWLSDDGVEKLVMKEFNIWNQRALDTLSSLRCDENIRSVLHELSEKLLMRNR